MGWKHEKIKIVDSSDTLWDIVAHFCVSLNIKMIAFIVKIFFFLDINRDQPREIYLVSEILSHSLSKARELFVELWKINRRLARRFVQTTDLKYHLEEIAFLVAVIADRIVAA